MRWPWTRMEKAQLQNKREREREREGMVRGKGMYDIVYFVEKMVAELHCWLNSSRPDFLVRIYSSADK